MRPGFLQSSLKSARATFLSDFFASIVVFLVALPLCMGIALASGAPIAAGLLAGIVGGLIVGTLTGSPLQVSGPAAGLTVIVYEIVQRHGWAAFGCVAAIAGLIQIAASLLKLGQWFRAVSPAVIRGMLSGIGILIVAGQFHTMVDDRPKESALRNIATLPEALRKGLPMPHLGTEEERAFEATTLRTVGELHRRQLVLAAACNKLTAHGMEKGEAPAIPTSIKDQQAELASEIEALAGQVGQFQFATESAADVEKLHSTAVRANRAAAIANAKVAADDAVGIHAAQHRSAAALEALAGRLKNHDWAAKIGLLTIVVLLGWQSLIPSRLRSIPAPLVAVVLSTCLVAAVGIPVLFVEVPNNILSSIELPSFSAWTEIPFASLLQSAFVLSIIASTETLLSAGAVDRLHPGARANYDRELLAQGVGNTVCGLIGALPITGVIVRSSANVRAGARTRLSTVLHGVWLLGLVSLCPEILRRVPTASLAAVLVYTGFKLIDLKALREFYRISRAEAAVYAATVVMIVATDLLTGVLVGLLISAGRLLYLFSKLRIRMETDEPGDRTRMRLQGSATFLRLPSLAAALELAPKSTEIDIDVRELVLIDHACLDLLTNWAREHEIAGGRLTIDWDELHARFRTDPSKALVLSGTRKHPVPSLRINDRTAADRQQERVGTR